MFGGKCFLKHQTFKVDGVKVRRTEAVSSYTLTYLPKPPFFLQKVDSPFDSTPPGRQFLYLGALFEAWSRLYLVLELS